MELRLRPSLVAAAFIILFAVIANLGWATAITTTGVWFETAVSLQVYALASIVATLLAVVLVTSASRRASALETSLHRVDRRIALIRAKATPRAGRSAPVSGPVSVDELDVVETLDRLADGGTSTVLRLEREGHDTLVPVPPVSAASNASAATHLLREFVGERIALREARARAWTLVAGPIVTCLLFLGIAGPMLPGSGGFAAAHYQLNTALVLFLAYGLAPLVAWSVITLGMVGAASRTESV